jgi:hypothetical protein
MKHSNQSKRQVERNEAALRQMLSVVLFKYHSGCITLDMNEVAQILLKIKSFDISTVGKEIRITITAKEAQNDVTS